MGALEFAFAFLKYCEACAAAMDESKTNSPSPMYFSATLRADSFVIRSRSGLRVRTRGGRGQGKGAVGVPFSGCVSLQHAHNTATHDRPDERFTPASRVEKRRASAV